MKQILVFLLMCGSTQVRAEGKSFIGLELSFPTAAFRTSSLQNSISDQSVSFGRALTVRNEVLSHVFGSLTFSQIESSSFGLYTVAVGGDYLLGDKLFFSPGFRFESVSASVTGDGSVLTQDVQTGTNYKQTGFFLSPRLTLGVAVDNIQFYIFYQFARRIFGSGSLSSFENSYGGFAVTLAL